MKKLFLSVVVAALAVGANAQVWLGGEVGMWRNYQDNKSHVTVQPEVGYNLSDKWAIATKIGYIYNYNDGDKVNAFTVSPYARYTFAQLGPVNLFLDGGFGFATYKVKPEGGSTGDAQNAWEVGLKPGVAVNLTEKLSFVTHVGFLGWRDADEQQVFGENGLGFDFSGNTLTFGLYYNF